VVPASQCGSIIGKGGAKIKEIREVSFSIIFYNKESINSFYRQQVHLYKLHQKCYQHQLNVLLQSQENLNQLNLAFGKYARLCLKYEK